MAKFEIGDLIQLHCSTPKYVPDKAVGILKAIYNGYMAIEWLDIDYQDDNRVWDPEFFTLVAKGKDE